MANTQGSSRIGNSHSSCKLRVAFSCRWFRMSSQLHVDEGRTPATACRQMMTYLPLNTTNSGCVFILLYSENTIQHFISGSLIHSSNKFFQRTFYDASLNPQRRAQIFQRSLQPATWTHGIEATEWSFKRLGREHKSSCAFALELE